MRKLASIRRIIDVKPIPDADAIECAVVDGWSVVVKKGEVSVGDLVVYFEVDSFIPNTIAPFLSKSEPKEYNGVKGERLRTVKLRGQLSQGLILPLETLFPTATGLPVEGQDVTEILGIQKWEAPIPAQLAGQIKGNFPSQVPKTDEERIQNLVKEFDLLKTKQYEVTEKLEGSSMTVGLVSDEFVVCSRNLSLKESDSNSLWHVARRYDIETKLRKAGYYDLVLQGELIGEGVQGNHYGIRGQDFYVFSVYDIRLGRYVTPEFRKELCKELNLKHVPIIADSLSIEDETVDSILTMANGKSQLNNNVLREGLVFKAVDGQEHWKAVSNEYLLKSKG